MVGSGGSGCLWHAGDVEVRVWGLGEVGLVLELSGQCNVFFVLGLLGSVLMVRNMVGLEVLGLREYGL